MIPPVTDVGGVESLGLGASVPDQALVNGASASTVSALTGFDPSRALEIALKRIVSATHCHIDGRDLLAEIHPRKTLDIKRRVDGVETWFEGDWLSAVWSAVKEAKALLYSMEVQQRSAQGMSAGTAETAQQAQGEARQPGPAGMRPGEGR